ncbi:hypothetical protein yc1106_02522 [Curvularia clavata]|uniref:Uncharacterized protein n=1 Tax=Curvularia clavata TaxID=95742 RepID=A0A9Q9DPJ6_CURCL|nr:hypothetical protein yc1106_02522 [Curvularia clavata]
MAFIFNILLLAAFSTRVVGGPVPRNHQRSQFTGYFNTTSTVSSVSGQKTVQADTAIVVEPIQETVFTSIAPAITFVNPDGQPLVTQDPQTVFSTSFITPTPKPTSDKSSSPLSTSATTPDPRQAPTGNSPLPTTSVASSALSSTVKAVENSTASGTSRQVPKFTYSPAEKETSTAASPTDVASEAPVPTSGGMPGFQHPGSAGPSLQPSNSTSSSAIVASSAVSSVVPSGSPVVSSSRSRIVVTSYTTVYVSAPLPDAATTARTTPGSGSATPTQTQQPSSSSQLSSEVNKQPTCSEGQEAAPSVTSSPAQALPSASLQVPPVVIVTSFTTVMASVEPSSVPQVPATSAVPEPVVPSSLAVSSASEKTSSPAEVTPSANPTSSPSLSSSESSTLAKPTSSSVVPPGPPAQPSSSTTPPASTSAQPTLSSTPSPSQVPASTSNAAPSPSATTSASSTSSSPPPPPTPSSSTISSSTSTSEGPLIITPIPPSQVFTVTETATKTEKETVRETVTVTAS